MDQEQEAKKPEQSSATDPSGPIAGLLARYREHRRLSREIKAYPEQFRAEQKDLEGELNDYRLLISGLSYKAADTDRRVWDLYEHINTETDRLSEETTRRPMFFRRLKDLNNLYEAWERLRDDQGALSGLLERVPAELSDYNERQIQREFQRQEDLRRAEYEERVRSARESLDRAMAYIEQLNNEGRVTFGSSLITLDDAQKVWQERIETIQEANRPPDELVLSLFSLENMVREAPMLSMRVREVEDRFARIITRQDMLASFGKGVIPQKEIARMTIKLHEQVPQLWATGQRLELEKALDTLEAFIQQYDSTLDNQLNYLERRRPGLTRALVSVADGDENTLTQLSNFARSLTAAIDLRDRYMRGHSEAVSSLAGQIARAMNWKKTDRDFLMIAALLHDVGKLSIPENILNKPGELTGDEWQTIQMHPFYGAQIVKPIDSLARIIPWIYHHQERWDGRGYPDHLTARQIPVPASIIALAEAYSVMTVDFPNRPAMTQEQALEEIKRQSGTQFNPEAIEALETALQKPEPGERAG